MSPSRRRQKKSGLYAAVDLGTNNCRLLIAEQRGTSFRIIDSHSQISRLGEGLQETGRLSEASMARTMDALGKIRQKIRQHGVFKVRCIATEACRRADNGRDFIKRVQDEIGLTFKIIDAKEEAWLATIGCHDLFDQEAKKALVLDIGGGSTELCLLNFESLKGTGLDRFLPRPPFRTWTSLPLGVVTLTEAFNHLPEEEAFPAMRAHALEVMSNWKGRIETADAMALENAHIVGTSGTVTCLAGVHLKLDKYRRDRVDGTWLSRDEAQNAINKLSDLGLEGRAKLPTIGPDRALLMPSGCAIVEAAWELFPAKRLRVADRGLREGLLLSMMYGPKKKRRRAGKGRKPASKPANAAPSTEATP